MVAATRAFVAQRARVADAPVGRVALRARRRAAVRRRTARAGAIAPGCRADLVVLDTADPALAEQGIDTMLDAAIFGPCRRPVRDVMVGGRWVVRDGHHADEDAVLARYRTTMAALAR